ncbi:DUF922 domain-containing protein [Chitinophaga lutea]
MPFPPISGGEPLLRWFQGISEISGTMPGRLLPLFCLFVSGLITPVEGTAPKAVETRYSFYERLPVFTGVGTPVSGGKEVVKVIFQEETRAEDPASDTLFYHQRRTTAADYRGQPRAPGRNEAVSFTSFGFEGGSHHFRDTLEITLVLQVFWVKSASWTRTMPPNARTLDHEQLHFDITRLAAEHFRRKVLDMPLTADDHDSRIQYEYLEYFREMNRLQDAFDEESAHGTNPAAEEAWKIRIRRELRELSVADPPVKN